MGFGGNKLFPDVESAIKGFIKKGKEDSVDPGPSAINKDMEGIYVNDTDEIRRNWYSQKPYAFIFTNRKGTKSTFYLPIAPSNINIVTHFATNVVSTMYGTIEEHSEQRYYDITIAGTTGMVPRNYKVVEDVNPNSVDPVGRVGQPIKSGFSDVAGGFFKRTLSLLENTINQASDLFGQDKASSGIDLKRTGYVAFHNFYKFLLAYKKDTSGEKGDFSRRGGHPLQFANYKDNNQYDVAIQQFQLTRDASEPFLYNYNITMRAYNLRTADLPLIDRDVNFRKEELGLNGIQTSALATLANKAAQAKRAAYSAVATAKGFGS